MRAPFVSGRFATAGDVALIARFAVRRSCETSDTGAIFFARCCLVFDLLMRVPFEISATLTAARPRPRQTLTAGRAGTLGAPPALSHHSNAPLALEVQSLLGSVLADCPNGSFIDKRYAVKGAASYVKNIDETIEKIMSEALK